jgi:hypothetical protein
MGRCVLIIPSCCCSSILYEKLHLQVTMIIADCNSIFRSIVHISCLIECLFFANFTIIEKLILHALLGFHAFQGQGMWFNRVVRDDTCALGLHFHKS